MPQIPTYALYGEREKTPFPERLHCESIAARSRLYHWEIQPHRHDGFFQILYIRQGGGEAWLDGRRVPITPPCVITVPALTGHGFVFSRDVDGVVITLVEKHLDTLLADAPALRAQVAITQCLGLDPGAGEAADLARLFEAFVREFEGAAPGRLAAIQALLSMALVIVGRLRASAAVEAPGTGPRGLRHLQRFSALVDRSFRERHSVGFYAEEIGITPTQLNRVCRQVLGKSALGLINDRILLEAGRDLAYTALSIKEIALTLGFADTNYFSRFFAKQTGQTPTAFREGARRQLMGERGAS